MTAPLIRKVLEQFREVEAEELSDKLAATRAEAIAAGLTLAQEYADKWAGLKADAIRTQGDTK